MKTKRCYYTKANGERSERIVVVIAEPRENYLVYDVSEFTDEQLVMLAHYMDSIENYRDETMKEFSDITGIKQSTLWRSFKPEGIEWDRTNEIQATK